MIIFFRRIFSSKIGLFFSLVFIALIAIAFAGADVGRSSFGGVAGGNVAKIGDTSIGLGELREEVRRRFDAARQENPALDMKTFVESGGVDETLDSMVNSAALEGYAKKLGFGSTKALEDAEIRKIPAFAGIDGTFDQTRFEQAIKGVGLTEKTLRDDIRRQLLIRQMTGPVTGITKLAPGLTLPYASLLLEARDGRATFLPATAYAPTGEPDAKAVADFYAKNSARYTIPERRVVRYAEFGEATVGKAGAVTDADIAKFYADNKADYAASETRKISQVIASDRAIADKIAAAAKGGATLNAAAGANGLAASEASFAAASDLSTSIGAAAAKAVFAAPKGAVVGPLQGPLGWVVTRVEAIDGKPARDLASVRDDIRSQLVERKRQEALIDLYNSLQDQLGGGADIAELADAHGLKVETTKAITAGGTLPGSDAAVLPDNYAPVVSAAFEASEENFGEIVTIEENKRYALVDVTRIVAAAPPPLKDIREQVARDYRLAEGAKNAKVIARKIAARVEKGEKLEAAVAAEKVPSFTTQKIGGKRADMARAKGRIPPELSLLFSMAPKSVKTLEIGNNAGWMVVYLESIDEGDATKEPGLIEAVSTQLASAMGNEYVGGMLNAAKKAMGVELNADAIATLKRELTGSQ
ncbi:peptidylprolyl isomerase [Flavisphingopyxis soli]|nr:peptidylprolyl isomerase [Sphingorhabdus soli]